MRIERITHLSFLPMGQGLSIRIIPSFAINHNFIFFPHCILFDYGGNKKSVEKCLEMVPNKISLLILSHFDLDHISGVPRLFKNKHIEKIWFPGIGEAFRLMMAIKNAQRGIETGIDNDELIEILHLSLNPTHYINQLDDAPEIIEAEELSFSQDPEIKSNLPPLSYFDDLGSSQNEMEAKIEPSRGGMMMNLNYGIWSWYEFIILYNGSKQMQPDSNLNKYFKRISSELGFKKVDIKKRPLLVAQIITEAARKKTLKPLADEIKINPNDTSMVVAIRPTSIPNSNSRHNYITIPANDTQLNSKYIFHHLLSDLLFMEGKYYCALFDNFLNPNCSSRIGWHTSRKWAAVLTGDLGKKYLSNIEGEYAPFLQVPHHGSKYSLSQPFYGSNHFEVGIISHGLPNSYSHPHKEILNILKSHDIRIVSVTQYSGLIAIHCNLDIIN